MVRGGTPADGSELGGRNATHVHHGVQQPPVVQLDGKLAYLQLRQDL